MATPRVTNIYPNYAHAGGQAMVRILGWGFRVPLTPLDRAYQGPTNAGVAVYFGEAKATYVVVANKGLLYVRVPPSVRAKGAGTVSVTVQNLDEDGNTIDGESYVFENSFAYRAARLTDESTLTYIVRSLILSLKREVISEVMFTPHSDYDPDTGDELNIVAFSRLPSLVLIGPQLPKNRFYSLNQEQYVSGLDRQVRQRTPMTVDIRFRVVGAAELSTQLMNLEALLLAYFNRSPYFEVYPDPNDPDKGTVKYEIELDRDVMPHSTPNDSNVRSFSAEFVIRGVDIGAVSGFDPATAFTSDITEQVGGDADAIILQVIGI